MRKVLAVDDSKVALMQVKKFVGKIDKDCEVTCVTDPREGIKIIQERGSEFDLLVLDFNMENMTGLDVIEAIKDTFDLSKVVVCTANLQKILRDKMTNYGAHFIEKPLSQDKLTAVYPMQSKEAS